MVTKRALWIIIGLGWAILRVGAAEAPQPPSSGTPEACAVAGFWAFGPEHWHKGVPAPFQSLLAGDTSCTGLATYDWDFGDGSAHSSEPNPSHAYSTTNTFYTYTCVAKWPDGQTRSASGSIVVYEPYQALTAAVPRQGYVPLTVHFYTLTDSRCSSVLWEFGDGTSSTEANPTHTYTTAGWFNPICHFQYWSDSLSRCFDTQTDYNSHGPIQPMATCAITSCAVTAPQTARPGDPVNFREAVVTDCQGQATRYWSFGDGTTSQEYQPQHFYSQPGTYHWTYIIAFSAMNASCSQEGTIVIQACGMECAATVPDSGKVGIPVNFASAVTPDDCQGTPSYDWDFGDGSGHSAQPNPAHTYSAPGEYTWKLKVTVGEGTCEKTGKIMVGCVQVGTLSLCAATILKQGDTYLLSGDVNINGAVWISADARYTPTSSTTGTLTTDGNVEARLRKSSERILRGPGLSLDVDGNPGDSLGTLVPTLTDAQILDAFSFPFALYYLPTGKPITIRSDGVAFTTTVYIGGGYFVLASYECSLLCVPGGDMKLLGFKVTNGQLGQLKFAEMSGDYDYGTGTGNFHVELGFPFADQWGFSLDLILKPSCAFKIDGAATNLSFPVGVPLLPTPFTLEASGGKFGNLCDPSKFYLWFGGDFGIAEIPDEVIGLGGVGLGIQLPYYGLFDAGTCKFFGYPLGAFGGRLSMKPGARGIHFRGWVNLADLLEGDISGLVNGSTPKIMGSLTGALRVPDFSCAWNNVTCRTLKRVITSAVDLPLEVAGTTNAVYVHEGEQGWEGEFRCNVSLANLSFAAELVCRDQDCGIAVGTNFGNLITITEGAGSDWPESAEKAVAFAGDPQPVIFSAGSNSPTAPVPALTLRNPSGQTITPSNAGTFPGVSYAESDADKVALFRVESASAGTWTLSVGNLAESQVSFAALVPHPAPQTAFRSVTPGGTSVSIQAAVSPPSASTQVGFFYTQGASDGAGFPIAEGLPATSGTVSTTWDTSGLPAGSYTVFAVTDDGFNAPVVTYRAEPVAVGTQTLSPPTGLAGSWSGSSLDLSWAPSSSASVRYYNVLYTDAPDLPGYPFIASAALQNGTRIEGLDPAKKYRFAVAGYDENRTFTPESAPWYSGGAPPADVRALSNRIAASDSVGAGLWKYFVIALPDSPQSLKVITGGASADLDLYLKFGAKPSLSSFDYKAETSSGNESLSVGPSSQPTPLKKGDWYIGVYGKQPASFSLSASWQFANPCSLACSATVPSAAQPGTPVAFRGSASAPGCSSAVGYLWDFGDGSAQVKEQNPSHAYGKAGIYTWTLTARSGYSGCSSSGTIAVGEPPPCTLACDAQVPPGAIVGIPAAFRATATASDCPAAPTYAWTFGDGATSSLQNPSHTYTAQGTFAWTLTVTASGAEVCTRRGTIVVTSVCTLSCDAFATPTLGSLPLTVSFAGTATPVNCGREGDDPPGAASRPEAATRLTSGVPVSGNLGGGQWATYVIAVPQGATQLAVQTAGASVDMDLYVRYGSPPDADDWDYRPFTPSGNEIVVVTPLSVPRPIQAGDWYIGVYASAGSGGFTVSATVGNGGSGVALLSSGVPRGDTVAYDPGFLLYSVEVPAGSTQLTVATTGAEDDIDLYVRYGNAPDSEHWDYRPYTLSGNESVTVTPTSSPRPLAAGVWFFAVAGFCPQGCPFTITATVTGGTPPCTLACTATAPAQGIAGQPVAFSSTAAPDHCTGSPEYAWAFGDGGTSAAQNPSHTYASEGTYTWSLTVSIQGVTCTKSGTIVISNPAGTTYAWTFGDGATSALQNPTHAYTVAGTFTWTMSATWNGQTCGRSGVVRPGIPAVPGDCDGNGTVSIGEVQKAINMFLGSIPPDCGVDCNGDGTVSIGEVQKVINGFLGLASSC